MLQRVLLSCVVVVALPASSVAQTNFADLVILMVDSDLRLADDEAHVHERHRQIAAK